MAFLLSLGVDLPSKSPYHLSRWSGFSKNVSSRVKQVTPAALLLVLLGCLAVDSRAQGEASISGIIFDALPAQSRAPQSRLKALKAGLVRKSLTDTSGHYNVSLLGVGNYEITAEMSGFQQRQKGKSLWCWVSGKPWILFCVSASCGKRCR